MNLDWREFLSGRGTASQAAGLYAGLGDCGLLQVEGEDAAGFLQGQVTCNVTALEPGRWVAGAACTPKGRVIADFRLLRGERGYFLLLAADLAEPLAKRLRMFVMRSKVTITDRTPEWGTIALLEGMSLLPGLELPAEPGAFLERDEGLALRLDHRTALVLAETAAVIRLWGDLEATAGPPAPAAAYTLRLIEAGWPGVVAATTEAFLPQMLNLDALGGISFNKGCYTGQEVVTRTHYLGQVKRRMFRLRGRGEVLPAPGAALFAGDGSEAREAGQVVLAAPAAGDGFQALAVVGLDYAAGGPLRFLHPDGPPAEILDLPYGMETA